MRETVAVSFVLLSMLGLQQRAIAHGVQMEYRTTQAIEVKAEFDSGDPMANAQVAVFAPNDPAEPWMTGTTNGAGLFIFEPDPAIAGTWEVQVRQAGHGDIIAIPVAETPDEAAAGASASPDQPTAIASNAASGTTADLSPVQKGMLGGATIWGFVGTALFFSSRKK